jgi:hypothetical protein
VTREVRAKIRSWREASLSAGQIAELLSDEGVELSVRTVERVLAEEGFLKLPRRTRLRIGLTTKGASVPEKSHVLTRNTLENRSLEADAAGAFLFAPFLSQLRIHEVVQEADLPGSKLIPALGYVLSFLALKLLGNERYAHVGDHSFDAGLGLFAGLNTLPKCTALSTYSYSLDARHIHRLQSAFVNQATRLGLYQGNIVNLDFHTVPHHGDESVLEAHWAGAHNKRMKGALTLFAQDASSKLMLYTAADIKSTEADEQVFAFLRFWKKVRRGVKPLLVFDSRFTTYAKLSELEAAGIQFITLRRRGDRLIEGAESLEDYQRWGYSSDRTNPGSGCSPWPSRSRALHARRVPPSPGRRGWCRLRLRVDARSGDRRSPGATAASPGSPSSRHRSRTTTGALQWTSGSGGPPGAGAHPCPQLSPVR